MSSDFTLKAYRSNLELAIKRFPFLSFDQVMTDHDGRFILWRHDIDKSVQHALKMSQLEMEMGVRASYFIQPTSLYYNIMEEEILNQLRVIADYGHPIGLHYDGRVAMNRNSINLEDELNFQKELLESLLGVPINYFSIHDPSDQSADLAALHIAGMCNVTAMRNELKMDYCSDSNGYWRFKPLHEVLCDESIKRLMVLTHPVWWDDEELSPRNKILKCVNKRTEYVMKDYDELLKRTGRKNI